MSAANINNAGGVLIYAHVACCRRVTELVACLPAGWNLEFCTSKFLRQYVFNRKCLSRAWVCLSHFLLHCGGVGLVVSFPEGRVSSARAMHWVLIFAFFVGSCIRCQVVGVFPCSCSDARSAGFFGLFLMVKPGCFGPIPCLACSCPSRRGGCRAGPIMCEAWSLRLW